MLDIQHNGATAQGIMRFVRDGMNVQIIAPSGSGKTIIESMLNPDWPRCSHPSDAILEELFSKHDVLIFDEYIPEGIHIFHGKQVIVFGCQPTTLLEEEGSHHEEIRIQLAHTPIPNPTTSLRDDEYTIHEQPPPPASSVQIPALLIPFQPPAEDPKMVSERYLADECHRLIASLYLMSKGISPDQFNHMNPEETEAVMEGFEDYYAKHIGQLAGEINDTRRGHLDDEVYMLNDFAKAIMVTLELLTHTCPDCHQNQPKNPSPIQPFSDEIEELEQMEREAAAIQVQSDSWFCSVCDTKLQSFPGGSWCPKCDPDAYYDTPYCRARYCRPYEPTEEELAGIGALSKDAIRHTTHSLFGEDDKGKHPREEDTQPDPGAGFEDAIREAEEMKREDERIDHLDSQHDWDEHGG